MSDSPYNTQYYRSLVEDSESSAREVVPLIVRLFSPKTVVDVGCGMGTWTREYKQAGAVVTGIDGFDIANEQLLIETKEFERHDLVQPLRLGRRFDLVNCLEVAEHLPESRASSFVADLCKLGNVVVFSAAVPGQGGTHHINEQWQSYWIPFFDQNGFQAVDCIRPQIWRSRKVAWWYMQNMFAFIHRKHMNEYPEAVQQCRNWPTDLVHPRAYERATVPSEMSPRMLKEVARAMPYFPEKIIQHLKK